MKPVVLCLALLSALLPPQTPQLPRSQMPDLGRPTKPDDPLPTLDFANYFAGRWTFEWDVPESPLGPAGRITGTETYTAGIDGRFFESAYEGAGPGGKFKGRAVIIYNRETKTLARHETDSRGFSLLETGTVGADLGGAFTIYYESAPFAYAGKQLRLKLTQAMTSPVFYRVRAQLSVDGGPFTSVGNRWFSKELKNEELRSLFRGSQRAAVLTHFAGSAPGNGRFWSRDGIPCKSRLCDPFPERSTNGARRSEAEKGRS